MRIIHGLCIGLLLITGGCASERFIRTAAMPGQLYTASMDGVPYLSSMAPTGRWTLIENHLKDENGIRFFDGGNITGVVPRFTVGVGWSSIVFDANGKAFDTYLKREPHKMSLANYKSTLYSLQTGDYQGGMERYYRAYYTPAHTSEVRISAVIPSLVNIKGFICWQYQERQAYGPARDSEWGNGAADKTSFFIECPLWIDGKVGSLNVIYGMDVWLNQFAVAHGDNAPSREALIADLQARIKPALESLQIHLNVSQPPPNNSPATIGK